MRFRSQAKQTLLAQSGSKQQRNQRCYFLLELLASDTAVIIGRGDHYHWSAAPSLRSSVSIEYLVQGTYCQGKHI